MAEWLKLKASDGQEIAAYHAPAEGAVRGGLVLVQEIFGVNSHIRAVADGYAKDGFAVIAPALFDRLEPGIELGYGKEDMQKAFSLYPLLDPAKSLLDVAAAFARIGRDADKVGVLGFCYGGLISWLSATRGRANGFEPRCAVGYYAGGIGSVATETPACPVMLHFGTEDSHIGRDQVDAVREAHPEVQVFLYEGAGHAFNRAPDPAAFHPEAAAIARERSLAFLLKNLA